MNETLDRGFLHFLPFLWATKWLIVNCNYSPSSFRLIEPKKPCSTVDTFVRFFFSIVSSPKHSESSFLLDTSCLKKTKQFRNRIFLVSSFCCAVSLKKLML